MGRKPRIEFEGAVYHVIQRGNNREYIFDKAEDKGSLLGILEEVKQEFPFQLFGYVIMDNHYHLMLKRGRIPLYMIMQRINNQYSRIFNKKYQRTGHVFEGRYKGIFVKDDKYLLSLLRYIHQNPIEAHICRTVKEYPWSSDQFYRKNSCKLVDIDFILKIFSTDRKTALEQYDLFMEKKDYLERAKEFYEESDTIEDKVQTSGQSKSRHSPKGLDEILRDTGVGEQDFLLIKEGSRKRHLRDFKVKYAKEALRYGYTMKDTGRNIHVSAEAINKMV